MRLVQCGLCGALVSFAFAAQAEFSWELAGRVGETERDNAVARLESQVTSLSATYYFDPVEDENGPRALASFLDPATRVTVNGTEDEQTLSLSPPVFTAPGIPIGGIASLDFENEQKATDYSMSGQYVLPGSKWYAGGRYMIGDVDAGNESPFAAASTDVRARGLVAGKYFGSGSTRLELSLGRTNADTEQTSRICAIVIICFDATLRTETITDEVRIDVMHVRRFRSATYALFGGIDEIDGRARALAPVVAVVPGGIGGPPIGQLPIPPTPILLPDVTDLDLGAVRSYSVGAEAYPRASIGVRLGFSRFDGPTVADDAVTVGASWFFGRNVGLELVLSRADARGASPDTDRAALRVVGRL
jgi:hypothetical protein